MKPRLRRRVRLARVVLLSLAGFALILMMLERRLVYPAPVADETIASFVPPDAEDVSFESADGVRLHGWFFPHEKLEMTVANGAAPRAVLYCHGNGETVPRNLARMRLLRDVLGASIFVFDYRGYGKSEGKPYERGVIADGAAARRWLAERTGVASAEVVLYGRSLGTAVACALAADETADGEPAAGGAKALVLESAFTRLTDAAAHHYRFLPVRLLMRNRFDSLARIAKHDGPVFAMHGTDDWVVPIEQGRLLFEAAPGGPKRFVEIPHAGHNDTPPRECFEEMRQFLDTATSAATGPDGL
ncbi:putative aminoacrylate hydrolase RutD [Pseudobythopirellula maris]|uniref:Putative aminoacrylate hydrolase RutD n=1 Tax=Pseudobythopirellula maris TaxID=2527991 RepID=A0A5C5ZGL4_9BACT|nr:alpha/beta hydrolase [Pseudobythopirellula maris]TWT86559.1 putative aminoacrylate hydrolase RutD [Pseudobythopirellula maris]